VVHRSGYSPCPVKGKIAQVADLHLPKDDPQEMRDRHAQK